MNQGCPACALRRFLTALVLAALVSVAGAASRHVVQPKATTDHPDFATRALKLPDGATLAYYERAGTGPTLVLVPETHGDRTQFYEPSFLAQLDPKLRLLIVESRGQGRSWPPPTAAQASIEQYADDVLAAVAHAKAPHFRAFGLRGCSWLRESSRLNAMMHPTFQRHRTAQSARTNLAELDARRGDRRAARGARSLHLG
jgi:hypothetical protein